MSKQRLRRTLPGLICALGVFCVFLSAPGAIAGPYVTATSGVRWNDVGGVRWNDVGGVRWNDVGGVRWNDVGGVRWNDVGGVAFIDSQGVRWNDVGGVRWNDVGSLEFFSPVGSGQTHLDLELLPAISLLPDTSSVKVIVTYDRPTEQADIDGLTGVGILGGQLFVRLPMIAVNATTSQIQAIAQLPHVRSVWSDRTTSIFDDVSSRQIALPEALSDPDLFNAAELPVSGAGITIAVLDTGVDGTHADLPLGTKLIDNVRLGTASIPLIGFAPAPYVEGLSNTDLVLGHGTFVSSIAAGSGAASAGRYAGVAPGASILGISAGDMFIIDVLEGFDYILDHATEHNVRVVNCSWGTTGWFDPDDPVNVATRVLHDAGISVVFASGNHGPAPDTLNPYSVAPWVIGVGSIGRDGRLSEFSSRGIHEELIYHPTLVAPGEQIIAARTAALPQVDGIVGVADPDGGMSVDPEHEDAYTVSSGTSFAAPHVAGTIALLLEADPSLTPVQIKRLLQQGASPEVRYDRSEVGAGRLDVWAALAGNADPRRPFGAHVPGWMDQRPYTIVHLDPVDSTHTVAAASSTSIPIDVAPDALTLDLFIAWGDATGGADLDLEVRGPGGDVLATSATINGQALFGRAEGVHLIGPLPSPVTAIVSLKESVGVGSIDFDLHVESSVGDLPDYADVDALPAGDRALVIRAVCAKVITGRDGGFEPSAALGRSELARSVALVGGLRQRLPSRRSFKDVGPGHPDYPFIETAAGLRASEILVAPYGGARFRPDHAARRIEIAESLVRAAGLAAEAEARTGEPLGLDDEDSIPERLTGYVAVALDRGLIAPIASGAGLRFRPTEKMSRLDAARHLLRLAEIRSQASPEASQPAQASATLSRSFENPGRPRQADAPGPARTIRGRR